MVERNPSALSVGISMNAAQPLEKIAWMFLKRIKNRATQFSSNPALGYVPRGNQISTERAERSQPLQRYLQQLRHGNQLTLTVEEWIKKMWFLRV